MELIIDQKVVDALLPGATTEDFVDRMGIDAIIAPVDYIYQPGSPDGRTLVDEWGIVRQKGDEAVLIPVSGPIASQEHLVEMRCPDPTAPHHLGQLRNAIARFKGRIAVGLRSYDCMSYPFYLRGMENLLADLYENPELVEKLVDVSVKYHSALALEAIRFGADFIVLGDDYASTQGPLMKPAHFKHFFLPGLARIVATIKGAGAYCFKHTDGYVEPLMDMIVETGVDAMHPFERMSGMDLMDVKKRYGHRICVAGSVDCTELLCRGSPRDVAQETLSYLRRAGPGGGYILMSSNSIHSGVRPENYLAMLETVTTCGNYPIKV